MTLEQLKKVARDELKMDGQLSKGIRVSIISKVKAGEAFTIEGSTYDMIRISAALRSVGEYGRMSTTTIEPGRVEMKFNQKQ